jgi:hypothetical protein
MLFEGLRARGQVTDVLAAPRTVADLRGGAPTSENAEISACVQQIHQATGGKGTWLSDRGFDRHELMLPWLHWQVALRMASLADDPLGRYWPVVMPDTMPEVRDGATVTGAQH